MSISRAKHPPIGAPARPLLLLRPAVDPATRPEDVLIDIDLLPGRDHGPYGRCVTCSSVFVRDAVWATATPVQRDALSAAGFEGDGGHDECRTCVEDRDRRLATFIAAWRPTDELAGIVTEDDSTFLVDASSRLLTIEDRDDDGLQIGPALGDWVTDSACAQTDPELFFSTLTSTVRKVKGTCSACPARVECLEYALENRWATAFGVWGGFDQDELRQLHDDAVEAARSEAVRDRAATPLDVPAARTGADSVDAA